MNEILNKYTDNTIKNLDKNNINKIVSFLEKENCNFINDILEDYLDLFNIEYDTFIKIFEELNKKYNNKFLELASEDMNLLEEFIKNMI